MVEWSVDALLAVPSVERIVVALPDGEAAPEGTTGVPGGAVRSASVRAALAAAGPGDPVIVHHAARPLVTPEVVAGTPAAVADGDAATAARYFTPANGDRYRTVACERGIDELGVAEHVHRFMQSLDVWGHPWWRRHAHDDLDAYCEFVSEETDLRLGIEADFVPGAEDRMANLLDGRPWDYVVGSVHFLREAALDHDEWDVWDGGADPDKVWR